MGDMENRTTMLADYKKKTKQWNIGDKVTPIRGHLRGVPCVIKWSGWPVALVTIVTVHGCWRSVHPNNLRSIEQPKLTVHEAVDLYW